MKPNLFGYTKTRLYGRTTFVYLMQAYQNGNPTSVVKIGVSNNPNRRASEISKHWAKFGTSFKVLRMTEHEVVGAESIERAIHILLESKGLRREAKSSTTGASELFYYDESIEHMMNDLGNN